MIVITPLPSKVPAAIDKQSESLAVGLETIFSTGDTAITFDALETIAISILPKRVKTERNVRTQILRLGALVGKLCCSIADHAPLDDSVDKRGGIITTTTTTNLYDETIGVCMSNLLLGLLATCQMCNLKLPTCISKKMQLNGRKYPVALCRGKSGKYTNYSNQTGITKEIGQSTIEVSEDDDEGTLSHEKKRDSSEFAGNISSSPIKKTKTEIGMNDHQPKNETLESMTLRIRKFAMEREWDRFHTPRNISLALLGEMGELSELFQWKGDTESCNCDIGLQGWSAEERDTLGQEVADVAIYLIRLADVCHFDLGEISKQNNTSDDRSAEKSYVEGEQNSLLKA